MSSFAPTKLARPILFRLIIELSIALGLSELHAGEEYGTIMSKEFADPFFGAKRESVDSFKEAI